MKPKKKTKRKNEEKDREKRRKNPFIDHKRRTIIFKREGKKEKEKEKEREQQEVLRALRRYNSMRGWKEGKGGERRGREGSFIGLEEGKGLEAVTGMREEAS